MSIEKEVSVKITDLIEEPTNLLSEKQINKQKELNLLKIKQYVFGLCIFGTIGFIIYIFV
jgi:hypothetical protein